MTKVSSLPSWSRQRRLVPSVEVGISALMLLAIGSTSVFGAPVERSLDGSGGASVSTTERAPTLQELIEEAARRFNLPAGWIAAVMAVESRGDARALSPKGAIGLMQIMPETYAGLRLRYGLGADPWNPRDNVLAGAAYLRELYDRYGAPGFLAAYNAGPGRWDDYRLRGRPLAAETVAYLARLGPVAGGPELPTRLLTRVTPIRSPFNAPIFVALSTNAASDQELTDRTRIDRIIEANASAVGPSDGVFVSRGAAPEQRTNATVTHNEGALGARSASASGDTAEPASSRPNSLFPPRSGSSSPR